MFDNDVIGMNANPRRTGETKNEMRIIAMNEASLHT
jgi:hypothetical protein